MGRRFYLGAGILALLLVLGIFNGHWLDQSNRQIVQRLIQAEEAAQEGNSDDALALAQQAKALWQSSWNRVAVVADHTAMDEIDGLFSQLVHYAREGAASFCATCARVRELVKAVSDGHQFTWWNLL